MQGRACEDLNRLADEEFRTVVRQFVDENYPDIPRCAEHRLRSEESRPWRKILAREGWLCPNWPRAYGGMGLSTAKQSILAEEFEQFGCVHVDSVGIAMLGPLLIRYGTPAQRQFFLPKVISGEHIWAQGCIEPDSDAGPSVVRTEATFDGEEWTINGRKTWTTLGNDANWIFILARTDRTAGEEAGISFLVVPMTSEGVHTIGNLEHRGETCEVLFDDVRVPLDHLVGDVNDGWAMAKALSGHERGFADAPRLSANTLACPLFMTHGTAEATISL